jgi:hypothetical protein
MGLRLNPQTGQMEDDGTGALDQADLNASFPHPAPPMAAPMLASAEPPPPAPPPPLTGAPAAGNAPAGLPGPGVTYPAPEPAPLPTLPVRGPVPLPPMAPPKAPAIGGGGGSPSERQLRSDLSGIQAEQERVAAQKGDIGVQRAGLEQKVADQQVTLAADAESRRAALEQATEAEVARRQSVLDTESEKYKSMGFKDFWSRASIAGKEGTVTGARILGAISMALGAAGASLAHTPNFAQEMIDKAIDRDYQMQRDSILKQKDVVTEARMGVEGARQAKADKLLALENWRKSAYEQAGAQAKAMLAKMGVPEAEADKNALVVATRQKAFDSQQALTENVAKVSNLRADTDLKRAEAEHARAEAVKAKAGEVKPLTESQAKSSELAGRMTQDNETLNKLGPISAEGMQRLRSLAANEAAFDKSPRMKALAISKGILKTPEQLLNAHDRLAYAAGARFINSFQRGDSGGAIAAGEYLMGAQLYMPQPGDSPVDIEAKRVARQQIIQGKLAAAGAGAQAATAAGAVPAPAVPGPAASAKPQKIRTKSGRPATLGPDGQYHYDEAS